MKKNIFLVLFFVLYLNTVLSQSLPFQIFKVDYFGNKTLLLTGETNPFEGGKIIAYLLTVRTYYSQIDTLSDFVLETKDSSTTLSYTFFKTEDVGLVDFEEENQENRLYLSIEVEVPRVSEEGSSLEEKSRQKIFLEEEVIFEQIQKLESVLENCAHKMVFKNLGSQKN